MNTSKTKENKYTIAVVPGDGIGTEVMDATISVLNELDIEFNYIYAEAGDACLEKTGSALPQETLDIVRDADACLFGAAGETAADVIVKLRQEMKMFANLRPVKAYPHTNSLSDEIDFMIDTQHILTFATATLCMLHRFDYTLNLRISQVFCFKFTYRS